MQRFAINMQKIILAFCLALAVAMANGEPKEYGNNLDDFLSMHRQRHDNVLEQYGEKLRHFKELYVAPLYSTDLIVETLEQTRERLNPIAILNDHTKQCVANYGASIPTIFNVQTEITNCVETANKRLASTIHEAVDVMSALEKHFKYVFQRSIQSCFNTTSPSSCVKTVVDDTDKIIHKNQLDFAEQLEAAICVAKTTINKAFDCNFTVQENAVGEVAKANILINRCIKTPDNENCAPCKYYCNDMLTWPSYYLSGKNIINPLHGRTDNPKCLILCVE